MVGHRVLARTGAAGDTNQGLEACENLLQVTRLCDGVVQRVVVDTLAHLRRAWADAEVLMVR